MPLKLLLADDEVLARQKLRQLLQDQPDIEILGEGANAMEVIDLVQFTRPDVILLDIQMPGMDGFDLVRVLSANPGADPSPRIIFTTAYDQYALKAFEVNAVDYLLKPFTRERLMQALQRAKSQTHDSQETSSAGKNRADAGRYESRIVFKSKGRILFLPLEEINWIAAEENYIRIHNGRETHLLRETMSRFESKLDPQAFLRVHRSAIVNLKHVKEIRTDGPDGEAFVLMRDGQRVPISRGYRSRITQFLAG